MRVNRRRAAIAFAVLSALAGACIPDYATRDEIRGGSTSSASTASSVVSSASESSAASSSASESSAASGGAGGSSCPDGQKDGEETDVDCGGPHCPARCALGLQCDTDNDCDGAKLGSGGSGGAEADAGGSGGADGGVPPAFARCYEKRCVPPLKATWVQKANAPFQARRVAGMAYDRFNHQMLLYGGYNPTTQTVFSDGLWVWDGAAWSSLNASSAPGAVANMVFAYDSDRARVVMFSGQGLNLGPTTSTWEWDGSSWTSLSPAMFPSSRAAPAFGYDTKDHELIVFGGLVSGVGDANDTWAFSGVPIAWKKLLPPAPPSPRWGAATAYDEARQELILFGGTSGMAETWGFDGATWSKKAPTVSPPGSSGQMATYDTRRRRVVMFGGGNGAKPLNRAWEWDGVTWAETTPAVSPAPRAFSAFAFDSDRGRAVLFGGSVAVALADTWEYSALGNACTSAADCDSGFCVDGLCCAVASCGPCQACNVSPDLAGDCAAVPAGSKDIDSCKTQCDGKGNCE